MKIIQVVCTLLLMIATLSGLIFGQTVTTDTGVDLAGTEFRVAFIQHVPVVNVDDYQLSAQTLTLHLTNVGTAIATVEIQSLGLAMPSEENFIIPAGETKMVALDSHLVLIGTGIHAQHVHVTSDERILAEASMSYFAAPKSLGGFAVLPDAALAADYIALTHCVVKNCVIVVLATENNTSVAVSMRISNGGRADFNNQTFADGENITVTGLNSGESIQVLCFECDMTGSRIQSDKKVAVFSGGEFTEFLDRPSDDLAVEQMIPLNAIGREYVLGSTYVTDVATLLKIVPLQAGDQFLYNNVSYTATRDRQVFEFESNITEIVHILADIPVFVGQLTGCTTAGNNPDLTMTLPVPVDQWETSYQMYVSSNEITSTKRNETFLCLLVPLGVEITVLGSDSPTKVSQMEKGDCKLEVTVSQMTQGDYVLLTVEVKTDGLVTVRCVDSTNCQPFTGYMLHNMKSRSSAFAMRKTLMTEDMTTSGMSSTSVGSSGTPLTSSESTTPFTITSLSTESRAATNSTVLLTGDTTHTDVPTLSSDATTTKMSSTSVQDAASTRSLVSSEETTTSTSIASTSSETSAKIDDASFSTVGDTKGTSDAYSPFSTGSSRTDDLSSSVADTEETSNVHSPLSTSSSSTEIVSSSVADTEGTSNAYSPFSTASSSTENVSSSVADSRETTNVHSPSTADATSVTNPHSQSATNRLCRCRCSQKEENKEDLASRTEVIKADLTIDKKKLSSYIRSKTSAVDRRMSSDVLGTSVGIVCLVVVFGFILALDVGTLVRKWNDRKQHKICLRELEKHDQKTPEQNQ